MIHKFKDSLVLGDRGEKLLLDTYSYLKPANCDAHDVVDTRYNSTVEIKTDYYPMSKTPNFFIEKYSDDYKFKAGGLDRAAIHKTDIFLYQFINDKTIFWFDDIPKALVIVDKFVREHNLQLIKIPNKGYNTLGYKIPRYILSDVFKEIKLGDELI